MINLLQISSDEAISLTERPENFPAFLGGILFVAFCLIALARLSRPALIRNLVISWLKVKNLRPFIKESLPLNKRGSIFLFINFFLSAGVLTFLKLSEFNLDLTTQTLVALGAPVVVSLFGAIALVMIGWVSGEYGMVREPLIMRIIGIEMLGLVFFIAALTWMLNVQAIEYIWWGLVLIVGIEFVSRIFKSIIIASSNGASWFYIILYLCTLEILPLLIAVYLVAKNF